MPQKISLYHGSAIAIMAMLVCSVASGATIAISCGAVGQELQACQEGAEAWAKKTGNEVKIISTPNSSTERLALYQQQLAAQATDIDVLQIDVIWPGILQSHLSDLSQAVDAATVAAHFTPIIQNNTVDGRLIALPWYTDAGLLYYRKDLLEKYGEKPPTSWAELALSAEKIQAGERAAGASDMQGFVFQGKAYEGLTCNALEWIDSYNGGTVVDDTGKITVNNPQAIAAISEIAGWIGKIVPQGALNYAEEEARGVFQSGNAVFMRNWPYAWSLAQAPGSAIKDKVGVTALPKGGEGGKNTGTLGGWQLAVSKYSKNQDAAIDLVKYLTSPEEQKRRAVNYSYNPTIAALYDDADVLKAAPFMGTLKATFTNAVGRPSKRTGEKYNQVSSEFFTAVHSVLSGQAKAQDALANLDKTLSVISRGGRW
jgi:trehalose/maltose transport system substrate-binding protein